MQFFPLGIIFFYFFFSLIVFSTRFSRCLRLLIFRKMSLGTKNDAFLAARFVTLARCEWSANQQPPKI
jgi:hypothetical protein